MQKQLPPDNVFIFLLDALRKDHLGLYGYPRKTSPNLDKFAQTATVYDWAFAPSSFTWSSIPSFFTAQYPVNLNNSFRLTPSSEYSLIKQIKAMGYKTAYFTANLYTSSNVMHLDKVFDTMWEELDETEINRPDTLYAKAETVMEALKAYLLSNRSQRNFIVVHLMETHGPYSASIDPVFKHDRVYRQEQRLISRVVPDTFNGVNHKTLKSDLIMPRYQLQEVQLGPHKEVEDFDRRVNNYIARYDTGIKQLDDHLQNIFQFLRSHKLFSQSGIAITSDHGELMGENNIFFSHGNNTHPSLINVPLIVKYPHQNKPQLIKHNVSLIDLLPTLFDLYQSKLDGQNLNKAVPGRKIYSFHPQSLSVVADNQCLMLHNGDHSLHGLVLKDIETHTFLFPSSGTTIDHFLKNFTTFQDNLSLTVFRKHARSFLKVSTRTNSQTLKLVNAAVITLLTNFRVVASKLKTIVNEQTKRDQIREDLETQLARLQNQQKTKQIEFQELRRALNLIQSSKFYQVWQAYNRLKRRLLLIIGQKK